MNQTPKAKPSPCDELEALLPAYVIGATTATEQARVEELLPLCPESAGQIEDYVALSSALLDEMAPIEPPADLHDRIIDAARATHTDDTPLFEVIGDKTPSRVPAWVGWAVAGLAAAALVLTNVYWVRQLGDAQAEIQRLQQENDTVITLATNQNLQRFPLNSTADETRQLATILWDTNTANAWLTAESLPQVNEGETYQLWLIMGETPVSAGLFRPGAQGEIVFPFQPSLPLAQVNAIGVSVEPESGSNAPTTTPLALGAT